MSFAAKQKKFGAEGFNPYAIANAAFESIRPERRTAVGGLAGQAGSAVMMANPAIGAALKVGGAIVDSYAYDPEAIEINDSFSSAENPTYTMGTMNQYKDQVEDTSRFGNIVTLGRNKKRERAAERETEQNYLAAQNRFNTAAGNFFDKRDTMKQYRSMMQTDLGIPSGNFIG